MTGLIYESQFGLVKCVLYQKLEANQLWQWELVTIRYVLGDNINQIVYVFVCMCV